MNRIVLLALSVTGGMGVAIAQTDSLSKELNEIVVPANLPATRLDGSNLVTVVSGSELQNLGTALDVLGQLPMISVGADGSVSVIGKGSPEILVNGRPLTDLAALTAIRSDNLAKVEVQLSPGAIFDGETRSVIRLTTSRNFIDGLSVSERAEAILRRCLSAGNHFDFNYNIGDWDLFLNTLFSYNNSLHTGRTLNRVTADGVDALIGSSQQSTSPSLRGSVKLGFNYAAVRRSFGLYWSFRPERAEYLNHGSEWIDNETPLNRSITRRSRDFPHLVSAYYEESFRNNSLFHFDGTFRSGHSCNHVTTAYADFGADGDVTSRDFSKSTLVAAKAYLTIPLWHGNFTVGTQDSYTQSSLDFHMFNPSVESYVPSALTLARQIAAAGFASWSARFGRLSLDLGLRYQITDYLFKVNGNRDPDVSRTFSSLTPDLTLGWLFNERSQVSLTYKTVSVKPPYARLTGSLSYVGRHEVEGGNPLLRDETMNNLQLFASCSDFMLQADCAFSRDSYGFVKKLTSIDPLRLLLSPVNLDLTSLSVYLMWNRKIGFWSPGLTLGLYYQWLKKIGHSGEAITASPAKTRPIVSYCFNNLFSLPGGWTVTVNISGSSAGDMSTNRFAASWVVVDASVSKSFLGNAVQLKLSATDILRSVDPSWSINACGVFVDKRQRADRSGISISVSYRFRPRRVNFKGTDASPEELKRL